MVVKNGYPDHIKLKAIKYYLEDNGFIRIERLMGIRHISVINWVKWLVSEFKDISKKCDKVDILELDEICVSILLVFHFKWEKL